MDAIPVCTRYLFPLTFLDCLKNFIMVLSGTIGLLLVGAASYGLALSGHSWSSRSDSTVQPETFAIFPPTQIPKDIIVRPNGQLLVTCLSCPYLSSLIQMQTSRTSSARRYSPFLKL